MTYDELLQARDWAERAVSELRDELDSYDEDSVEWDSVFEELTDAENEVDHFQDRLDTGDYDD